MAIPGGPLGVGGFEEYVVPDDLAEGEGYTLRFYPDINNEVLQKEGQAPVFYWAPQGMRLAKFADTNDFKFSHTHFAGVLNEDDHVGVNGEFEVVGGLLAFTTTSRVPPAIMQQAEAQIREKSRGKDSPFWRWFGAKDPQFTMVPISDNITELSSLAPKSLPPTQGPATPADERLRERGALTRRGVVEGIEHRDQSSLDLWAVQLSGEGKGSITGGENAYGGLLGGIPSELIWQAMHGSATPFFVKQHLLIPLATPVVELVIDGDWNACFTHFSAAAKAGGFFWEADIKAEFENMVKSGTLDVRVVVDKTVPEAAELEKELLKTKDMIVNTFTAIAQKAIFDPVPPAVAAAEAKSRGFSGWFGGFGAAMKLVRKQTSVRIGYRETRIYKYNRTDVISSTLEGLRRELVNNPEASAKYFHRVVLGDLSRKVRRVVRPTFAPSDAAHRMAVEVGYPTREGNLQWKAGEFTRDGGGDQRWEPEWVMWRAGEVGKPPAGWQPEFAYLRKRIFFDQDSDVGADPHTRIIVERDEMVIQSAEPTDEVAIDVRSSDGTLDILMQLGDYLETPRQRAEVEVKPSGRTADGAEREVVRFQFNAHDQDKPRRLKVYTGQPDYVPAYEYRVTGIEMGSLGSGGGRRWTGPWEPGLGNGPITFYVPSPDGPNVVVRRVSREEVLGLTVDTEVPSLPEPTPAQPKSGDRPKPGTPASAPKPGRPGADWPGTRPREREHAAAASAHGYDVTAPVTGPAGALRGNGDTR